MCAMRRKCRPVVEVVVVTDDSSDDESDSNDKIDSSNTIEC